MDLGDRIKHTVAVAKSKASQQKRLMQINSSIGKLESEIRESKIALADRVLSLFVEGHLSEENLNILCTEIIALGNEVAEQKNLQKQIKEERPPRQPHSSNKLSGQRSDSNYGNKANYLCPNCNQANPEEAEFCSNCGNSIAITQKSKPEERLRLCPQCEANVPSEAEFCNECGKPIPEI